MGRTFRARRTDDSIEHVALSLGEFWECLVPRISWSMHHATPPGTAHRTREFVRLFASCFSARECRELARLISDTAGDRGREWEQGPAWRKLAWELEGEECEEGRAS